VTTLLDAQEACRASLYCAAVAGGAVTALVCVVFCLVDNWLQERAARREFARWLERHREGCADPYRVRG